MLAINDNSRNSTVRCHVVSIGYGPPGGPGHAVAAAVAAAGVEKGLSEGFSG